MGSQIGMGGSGSDVYSFCVDNDHKRINPYKTNKNSAFDIPLLTKQSHRSARIL
jgi:hypothetical protein